MRQAALQQMIELAKVTDGPFSKCVREATEVGVVVPSILETNLRAAGFAINYEPGDGHGAWVLVSTNGATAYDETLDGNVARAFSYDQADALLQAINAELKEEATLLVHAHSLVSKPEFIEAAKAELAALVTKPDTTPDELEHAQAHVDRLENLAACAAHPGLMTRELLVSIATDKPLMRQIAAL